MGEAYLLGLGANKRNIIWFSFPCCTQSWSWHSWDGSRNRKISSSYCAAAADLNLYECTQGKCFGQTCKSFWDSPQKIFVSAAFIFLPNCLPGKISQLPLKVVALEWLDLSNEKFNHSPVAAWPILGANFQCLTWDFTFCLTLAQLAHIYATESQGHF